MRAGRLLRARARDEAAGTCPSCPHSLLDHRERPSETVEVVDGEVVTTPNPEYLPLHFACALCPCVHVVAA